jgi:hypothetical protein
MIHEIALAHKKSLIDENDILCDNQATICLFRNKYMVITIEKNSDPITVNGVGGMLMLNEVGELPGFGKVNFS